MCPLALAVVQAEAEAADGERDLTGFSDDEEEGEEGGGDSVDLARTDGESESDGDPTSSDDGFRRRRRSERRRGGKGDEQ